MGHLRGRYRFAHTGVAAVGAGLLSMVSLQATAVAKCIDPMSAGTCSAVGTVEPSTCVTVCSDRDVVIWRRRVGQDWVFRCGPPCDQPLVLADEYRAMATDSSDAKASAPFRLTAPVGGWEFVTIHTASRRWFTIGAVAIPTGAVTSYLGAVALYNGALGVFPSSKPTEPRPVSALAAGWSAFGVGLGLLAAGLGLVVENWDTRVVQTISPGVLAAASGASAPGVAGHDVSLDVKSAAGATATWRF